MHDTSPAGPRRRSLLLGVSLLLGSVASAAAPRAAQVAPDFTLRSITGANLRLAEQRGQVVMINFWATWCGPCRQELPLLDKLYAKYRDAGFVLLGVNIDDNPRSAAELANKLGLSFPLLLDTDKAVSKRYDVLAMPSTLILDREGRVRHVHQGYLDGYERTYEQQVRVLLKE